MEILAIIPARGGSKGIKRKNLKPILNKPLVAYSILSALNSKYITKVVVSSEDEEILEVSKKYGAQTILRPEELAQDETKTAPVMLHCLEELKKQNYIPDYVVLLQPTCPLRDENYIDRAFEYYFQKEKEGFDSCFGGFKLGITHSKWRILHNNKLECLYDFRVRPRRQDTDKHYDMIQENGAFYALKTSTMEEVKDFIGYNPTCYLTPQIIDIDTIEDFEKVENILKNKNA